MELVFTTMPSFKPLKEHEVPPDFLDNLNLSVQVFKQQLDGTNKLYVEARCSQCPKTYFRRVSDIRYNVKVGRSNVWICLDCRGNLKWISSDGYVLIYKPGHPNARKDGALFEHVFIMSEYLGRPLKKDENVHHKNGVRSDNRVGNLELWSVGQPAGQRINDKIRWAIELKDQYPDVWRKVRAEMTKESFSDDSLSSL